MRVLSMLIILLIMALSTEAFALDYKKTYCGNQEYVGNSGARYAHLHCGKSFFTLSRAKTDKVNFNGRPNCNKVDEVLADKQNQYGSANDPQAITNALDAYKADGCP